MSTKLGGHAFNATHATGHDDDTEREYDRLRDQARAEASKRNACFDKSRRAYESGDGAAAKKLSNEGKAHEAAMEARNREASEYIFRANNAPGRVGDDEVDLHGQFAEEAARILEARIREDRARGQPHLHAIVGKGEHSAGHVQRVKPRVETLCRDMGLRFRTEDNAGRIYIDLRGGDQPLPPTLGHGPGPDGGAGTSGGQHQPHQNQGQQGNQQDDIAAVVEKILPRILRKLERACCTVM